jgi:hypothetical protein
VLPRAEWTGAPARSATAVLGRPGGRMRALRHDGRIVMLLALLLMLGAPTGATGAATAFSLLPAQAAKGKAFSLVLPPGGRAHFGLRGFQSAASTTAVECAARALTLSPTIDQRILGPSRGAGADPHIRGDISPCLH